MFSTPQGQQLMEQIHRLLAPRLAHDLKIHIAGEVQQSEPIQRTFEDWETMLTEDPGEKPVRNIYSYSDSHRKQWEKRGYLVAAHSHQGWTAIKAHPRAIIDYLASYGVKLVLGSQTYVITPPEHKGFVIGRNGEHIAPLRNFLKTFGAIAVDVITTDQWAELQK